MSLQVNGKCQVYKVEDKGNFVTATLRTSRKDKDGNWQSEFYNAKFVGVAGAAAKGLTDKDKIDITKAALENREYQGKHYISVVVFEYVKEGQQAGNVPEEAGVCGDCGKPLDECDCLPF